MDQVTDLEVKAVSLQFF